MTGRAPIDRPPAVLDVHPALLLLARLKAKAWLRSARRRLSTPSGCLFALLGALMVGAWLALVLLRGDLLAGEPMPHGQMHLFVRTAVAVLFLMSLTSAFSHRGLYVPAEEIERLFSAPVPRAQIARYRILVACGRALPVGVVVGWVAGARLAGAPFAALGIFVLVLTLPLVGQALSVAAGDVENRLGRLAARMPVLALRVVGFVLLWLVLVTLVVGSDALSALPLPIPGGGGLGGLLAHPFVAALTLPFEPWARAVTARGPAELLPWLGLTLAIWLALFEGTARLPVDFRELSLSTSADVARRLRRLREGRVAIEGEASRRTVGWHVPWIFGRGPFGAVAWWRLVSMVRKARGTLIFTTFLVALLTFVARASMREPLAGALFLAVFGTIYLGWGLRFDFRSEFERMETIRSWPLASSRLFVAFLLPQTALVCLWIGGAIVACSLVLGDFDARVLLVLVALPLGAFLWLAIDNAFFLLWPVRFVPGQAAAMQHAGRGVVLVLLRFAVITLLAAALILAVALGWGIPAALDAPVLLCIAGAAAAGALGLACAVTTAVLFGGWALERFDVSSEAARG